MEQEILSKLETIWNAISTNCVCIFLGGSSTIDFINNKHDLDVIFVYENQEKARSIRQVLKDNEEIKALRRELKENYNVVLFGNSLEKVQACDYWTYQNPEVLFGTLPQLNHNVLENKNAYIKVVKENLQFIGRRIKENGVIHKGLYHSLIILYYIKNNACELSQEQIENINIVHDGKNATKITELYQWALEEINKL